MPRPLFRLTALALIAASISATGALARVGKVCLELPSGANTLNATIASGCLPTHPRYKDDFAIAVDAGTAVIRVDGAFKQVGNSRIASADCMGSRTVEYTAEAAGARRYTVMINDRFAGVLDASDIMFGRRTASACFDGGGRGRKPQMMKNGVTVYSKGQFADWIGRTRTACTSKSVPISGDTLGEVAAQLLGNHPEGTEGRQSAQIAISLARWRREPADKLADRRFTAITIEVHGFLDDSVSGERIFAATRQDAQSGEWKVTAVWRQYMCRRGAHAGQWLGKPCI